MADLEPITVVVPCHDEADRLDADRFVAYAADAGIRFLFVDDGSRDATRALLERTAGRDPARIRVLPLDRNGGKAEAVRQGVLRALEEHPDAPVAFWDADLATPLEVIPKFRRILAEQPGIAVVMGSRVRLLGRRIDRTPLRHYLGRIFATGASLVLGLPVYDTQCGAKAFRGDAETRRLFAEPFCSRWGFDVELVARLVVARRDAGGVPAEEAIVEVPLERWNDVAGSKVRPRDLLRTGLDLLRIAVRYRPRAGRARP